MASARPRQIGLIDAIPWPEVPDPPIVELVALAVGIDGAWGWTISGGEPTTRADLPDLIRALRDAGAPRLGLATDGLALTRKRVVSDLKKDGLERVRFPFHSGRVDAHDWIVDTPGAARKVRRAIETCAAAGLQVEIEIVVTRPTTPYLSETIEVLSTLGARVVHFCRPLLNGAATQKSVSISPRLGLLQPELEAAVRTARRHGMAVSVHDFPRCVAPGSDRYRARSGAELWLIPPEEAWLPVAKALSRETAGPCRDCPGDCPGAPADYVDRFGWYEFRSEGTPIEPADAWIPAPRGGWLPATRIASAQARSRGPTTDPEPVQFDELDVWLDPTEPTRMARVRLVHASQERPKIIRLAGGWGQHPAALKLLAETTLLYPEMHVVGELDRLDTFSDRQLKRLTGIARFEGLLHGSDAPSHDAITGRDGSFAATLSVLSRLASAGYSAVVRGSPKGVDAVLGFLSAWETGDLPGEPLWVFDGLGALESLAEMDDPSLTAALPTCLGGTESKRLRATWSDAAGAVLWPGSPAAGLRVCGPCGCGRASECVGVPAGCSVVPPITKKTSDG
jgi:MoaA/NifB/PqqE/SkfB family radical SAM enzyme